MTWRGHTGRPQIRSNPQIAQQSAALLSNGQQHAFTDSEKRSFKAMLWTVALILVILWALGMTTAYAASGLIHILLVIAIIVVLIRVIQGRRVL
jgi:hypothetical protein